MSGRPDRRPAVAARRRVGDSPIRPKSICSLSPGHAVRDSRRQAGDHVSVRTLSHESSEARGLYLYLHLVPEFEPSPTCCLHLALMMKDIRRTLRA